MVSTGLSAWAEDAPLIAFFSVLAASLGVPIPTFAALIFLGAILAHWHGSLGLPAIVFLCAMMGAAIGDIVWFSMGRKYGGKVMRLLCRISLSRDSCIRQTTDFFSHQGLRLFLVARFVPGLSTVGAPIAGATGVKLSQFYLYAALGAALWIGTGLGLGFAFADQISAFMYRLREFGLDLGGVAVALTLAYIGYSWFRRQRLLRRLRMARISVDEFLDMLAAGSMPVVIDVRSVTQRKDDPYLIPGSLTWQSVHDAHGCPDLKKGAAVIIYCACPNEVSAASVAREMQKLGFRNVRPLRGGLDAWRAAGQPITPLLQTENQAPPSGRLVTQAL